MLLVVVAIVAVLLVKQNQTPPEGMFWLQENGTWSLYQLAE